MKLSHRITSTGLSAALVALVGCGAFDLDADAPVEQVTLQIATIPPEVGCVRVTAAGPGRTVVREVDVAPGSSLTESFSGLPLGTVTFRAEAFPTTCEPVTKSTIPAWVSEPVPVAVALGRLSSVSLSMHRNGRAKVVVEFVDEAGGAVDAGVPR